MTNPATPTEGPDARVCTRDHGTLLGRRGRASTLDARRPVVHFERGLWNVSNAAFRMNRLTTLQHDAGTLALAVLPTDIGVKRS